MEGSGATEGLAGGAPRSIPACFRGDDAEDPVLEDEQYFKNAPVGEPAETPEIVAIRARWKITKAEGKDAKR
jgi:hypothetical protein